jgi:micrococcal nuclease
MDGKTLIQVMGILWCLLVVLSDGLAADFKGEVIRVLDGDTIEVLHAKKPERVRLYGIDCPERGQAFGQKAKQATSSLLFGKDVRVETHGRDKHRRTLGTVFDGDLNVNQELVKEGWCWWFSKYVPKNAVLKQLEQEAKDAKKGLWADAKPVPPWLYRRLDAGAYP